MSGIGTDPATTIHNQTQTTKPTTEPTTTSSQATTEKPRGIFHAKRVEEAPGNYTPRALSNTSLAGIEAVYTAMETADENDEHNNSAHIRVRGETIREIRLALAEMESVDGFGSRFYIIHNGKIYRISLLIHD
jgi:uncharacterized protein with von Willebrand factor type A (vWA) domain